MEPGNELAAKALTAMSNAPTADGTGVEFTLTTADGKSLEVWMPAPALHQFIHDLIRNAVTAAVIRTNGIPVAPTIGPMSKVYEGARLTDFSIAQSADRKKTFLLLRLFDFDLSFEAVKPTLSELAANLTAATRAMQADETKPGH